METPAITKADAIKAITIAPTSNEDTAPPKPAAMQSANATSGDVTETNPAPEKTTKALVFEIAVALLGAERAAGKAQATVASANGDDGDILNGEGLDISAIESLYSEIVGDVPALAAIDGVRMMPSSLLTNLAGEIDEIASKTQEMREQISGGLGEMDSEINPGEVLEAIARFNIGTAAYGQFAEALEGYQTSLEAILDFFGDYIEDIDSEPSVETKRDLMRVLSVLSEDEVVIDSSGYDAAVKELIAMLGTVRSAVAAIEEFRNDGAVEDDLADAEQAVADAMEVGRKNLMTIAQRAI